MVTAGALCRVVRLLGGETSATGSATGSASGSATGLGAGSSTANAGSNSGDGEAGGSTTFTGSAAFTMGTRVHDGYRGVVVVRTDGTERFEAVAPGPLGVALLIA